MTIDETIDCVSKLPDPHIAVWAKVIAVTAAVADVDPVVHAVHLKLETDGGHAPGYEPKGADGLGDHGHGHGLWQIDDRTHGPFLAATDSRGRPLWRDAYWNGLYAAKLERANLDAFSDCLNCQRQLDARDCRYHCAIASYNAGARAVRRAVDRLPPAFGILELIEACDSVTTKDRLGRGYLTRAIIARDALLGTCTPLPNGAFP